MLSRLGEHVPKLAIVRVGERPDDMSYERGATKKMESFGLRVQSYVFPEDVSDQEFKQEFHKINRDEDVTGILLLRPLPKQIVEADIEKMIDPSKDLDGISPSNIAKVFAGDSTGFAPVSYTHLAGADDRMKEVREEMATLGLLLGRACLLYTSRCV